MSENSKLSPTDVVFEDFLIEYYTNILKETKKQNNREFKKEVIEKLLQKNLFLIRRLRDPGFYRYVCREILKDHEFLKIGKQLIKKEIVDKLIKADFFFNPFSKIKDWNNFNVPMLSPLKKIIGNPERIKEVNYLIIEYFESKLSLAKIEGDLEKIKAIEVMIKDFSTLQYSIHELLINPFSPEPFTLNFIHHFETNLKNQKIKLHELYEQTSSTHLVLNEYLLQIPENFELMIQIIQIISDHLEIQIEQAAVLNKFINDIISILHFKWFDLKEKDEKWNILDNEYPFVLTETDFNINYESYKVFTIEKFDAERFKNFVQSFYRTDSSLVDLWKNSEVFDKIEKTLIEQLNVDEWIIIRIIESCQRKGYIDNAINGYKFLLSLNFSPEIEFICHKNLGNLYRKLNKIEMAIEHLEKALKSVNNKYLYQQTIVYRNLGICYHLLKNELKKDVCFAEVNKIANELNDLEKYQTYLNLAGGYEIVGDFHKALEYVLKITSSTSVSPALFELARNKFQIYKMHRNFDGSLNYSTLKSLLIRMDIGSITTFFRLQKSDFQFTEAKNSLKRALDTAMQYNITEEINLIVENLAELFILTKNKTEFFNLFSALSVQKLIPKVKIYKGVFLILNGKFNEGMNIFLKFYRNYFQIDELKFIQYLSPQYRGRRFNSDFDLPPILWFIKPLLCFNYNNVNNLISKMVEGMKSIDDKGTLLVDLGRIYEQCKSIKESIEFYQSSLVFIKSDINKTLIIFQNIAGGYVNLDDFISAENLITQILAIFEDKQQNKLIKPKVAENILKNLAFYHELKYDFPGAIKFINKAKEFSNDPELDKMEREYRQLNEKYLFYSAVDDIEIKNILHSSEIIYDKLSESSFEIDYSLIMLGYCKAIEILLDKKIIKKIDLSKEIERYYINKAKKIIDREIYLSLPYALQAILNYKNPGTIGIGQWPKIIEDLSNIEKFKNLKQKSKEIYYAFLNKLDKLIEIGKRDIIKETCENLFVYRNQSAHNKFHSKEEFLEEKPRIISNVNNILSIFQ